MAEQLTKLLQARLVDNSTRPQETDVLSNPPSVAVLVLTVLNVKRNVKLKALTVQKEGIGSTTTVRNYQIKK
jgi:hypothetical protein